MSGNYIKLNRSLLDWEWYSNANTMRVFIHCLLKANWKDGRFEGVDVPRGSFVTSVSKLSEETGLTVQQVRTAINHLTSTNEITIKTTPKFSVISIKNYCQYQDGNKVSNKRATNEQQTSNKRATTIEEGKKGITQEGKKKYYPHDEKLDQAFNDYVKMRKQIKKPMTDRAVTMAMNKLNDLCGGDNDKAIQILDQSILNSWAGIFPLHQDNKKSEFEQWRDA